MPDAGRLTNLLLVERRACPAVWPVCADDALQVAAERHAVGCRRRVAGVAAAMPRRSAKPSLTPRLPKLSLALRRCAPRSAPGGPAMSVFAISSADVLELGGDVGDEQLVGARLDDGAAALGQDGLPSAAAAARPSGREMRRPSGSSAGRSRCAAVPVSAIWARFEFQLFLGQLFLGRDPDHVAVLAHVQALGLQDDVERLVPGHVLQAQRQVAADGSRW